MHAYSSKACHHNITLRVRDCKPGITFRSQRKSLSGLRVCSPKITSRVYVFQGLSTPTEGLLAPHESQHPHLHPPSMNLQACYLMLYLTSLVPDSSTHHALMDSLNNFSGELPPKAPTVHLQSADIGSCRMPRTTRDKTYTENMVNIATFFPAFLP